MFRHEGLDFDPASGRFKLDQPVGECVGVAGDGLPATWTRHALERLGYRVDREDAANAVALVEVDGAGPSWRLRRGDDESRHTKLADLVRALGSGTADR